MLFVVALVNKMAHISALCKFSFLLKKSFFFRELWEKIQRKTLAGRRTGVGITAEGDMLAALNLRYGTEKATDFAEKVQKTLALAAYDSSVKMAKERGAFEIYNACFLHISSISLNN